MNVKLIVLLILALQIFCIFGAHLEMKRKKHTKPYLDYIRRTKGIPKQMRLFQKHRPLRRPLTKPTGLRENIPFPGNFTTNAVYYISIGVGSPSKQFTVQVDTGSADLAIPQTGCSCGKHPNPPFNPTSSGASPVSCTNTQLNSCKCTASKQCQYKIEYGDGSGFTAEIYNDTLSVGNMTAIGIVGGIVTEVTPNGPFEPYLVDGICGFGQKKLSVVEATPFPMTFSNAGKMKPLFSMCAAEDFTGGVLSLGEIGSYTGNLSYTPILTKDFYSVWVQDFLIDGESVGVDPSVYNEVDAIVDSGTNAIYWPNKPYNSWENKMIKDCGKVRYTGVCGVAKKHNIFAGYCFSMTKEELGQWPNVTMVLGKTASDRVHITLTPQQYITQGQCDDETQFALDFVNGPAKDGIIIGENVMLGKEIVYDYGNERIGFAENLGCKSSLLK